MGRVKPVNRIPTHKAISSSTRDGLFKRTIKKLCCVSILIFFINGWMFTDGYIAAIRDLGLTRFRFVLYTLSDRNREGSRHTFCFGVEIITNLTIVFVSLYFKVPQR